MNVVYTNTRTMSTQNAKKTISISRQAVDDPEPTIPLRTYSRRVLHAINLPLFGELADPCAAVELAEAAEAAGFDAFFVWDHVLSPVPGSWDVVDPWVVLSAIAVRTSSLRIGTMVTPLPRRRIGKLVRETVTLDRLSDGRLTLGLGAGGDGGREFSAFGEHSDAHTRAAMLDEGADLLLQLWTGEFVHTRGGSRQSM